MERRVFSTWAEIVKRRRARRRRGRIVRLKKERRRKSEGEEETTVVCKISQSVNQKKVDSEILQLYDEEGRRINRKSQISPRLAYSRVLTSHTPSQQQSRATNHRSGNIHNRTSVTIHPLNRSICTTSILFCAT